MTLIILLITGAISLLAFSNRDIMLRFQFNAYSIKHRNEWWRFFTYAFLHADLMHMAVNLFVLYSFGGLVEEFYSFTFPDKGHFYYILLYLGGILFSTLASFLKHKDNLYYNAVGASGAVSAVVFASIIFHPAGQIAFILLPVPIPAVVFGILYLIYSAYMAKRGQDNIGHDAHFWGAIFGIVFTLLLKPALALSFLEKASSIF